MQGRSDGRAWRRLRARILAASDVCHICGQPGADAVDHVIPIARGGTNDPSNLRPAHHDIPPKCNRLKGDRDYAPVIRRSRSLTRPSIKAPPLDASG